MNFKKNILAVAASASFVAMISTSAFANDLEQKPDTGEVRFVGTITDSPCSISPDSADQTVDMGMVSKAVIEEGNTQIIPFTIELLGCTANEEGEPGKEILKETVSVTFRGIEADGNASILAFSATESTASGAGITLVDGQTNNAIKLGEATDGTKIFSGNNTLKFGAQVVALDAGDVVPGEFTALANFELSYL